MFDLGRSFIAGVERSPNALAVVDVDLRLSDDEWYAEVCRVIDGLAALASRKGNHLAVVLQNRLAMASLHWLAALRSRQGIANDRARPGHVPLPSPDSRSRSVVLPRLHRQRYSLGQEARLCRCGDAGASVEAGSMRRLAQSSSSVTTASRKSIP